MKKVCVCVFLHSGFRKRGRRNRVASNFFHFFRFLPFSSFFFRFHVFLFLLSFSSSDFFRFLPFFSSSSVSFSEKKPGRHRSRDPFGETPINSGCFPGKNKENLQKPPSFVKVTDFCELYCFCQGKDFEFRKYPILTSRLTKGPCRTKRLRPSS